MDCSSKINFAKTLTRISQNGMAGWRGKKHV
jgi:hypothetical protein